MIGTVKHLLPPNKYPDKNNVGRYFYKIAFELYEEIGDEVMILLPDEKLFMITHKEGGKVMAESITSYKDKPKVKEGMKISLFVNSVS